MENIKFDGSLEQQMSNWRLAQIHGVGAVEQLYETVAQTQHLSPEEKALVDR